MRVIGSVLCLIVAAALSAIATPPAEIVLPAEPTPVEIRAAAELQEYLQTITGVPLPIRRGERSGAPAILVGDSPEARKFWQEQAPKTDEILVWKLEKDLIVAGGAPRGTLYAAYELLERGYQVRWWSSHVTRIPRSSDHSLPTLQIRYAPTIVSRESYYQEVIDYPEFAAHLRYNGYFEALPPELGGHYEIIGFCHTFNQLIPPDKYFAQHPEWFWEVDGKRDGNAHTGQLCLSNPELRRELTRNVLARLREHPEPTIISVSQNDSYPGENGCQCVPCRALNEAEGSPAGALLLAVNEVAEAVEKEFPDVQIDTLAYRYTRKVPRTVRPRHNVIVRLCSIECDFSQPIDSDANAAFRDDVRAWSAIAPQLAIWNYTANFLNYLIPHPNWRNLAADIRFFAAHRTISLYEQGQADPVLKGAVGDFPEMRAWVLAQLLWDPTRDQEALIDEFLNGYYGAAAPFLRRHLELMESEVAKAAEPLTCYEPTTRKWLSIEALQQSLALMSQAKMAVRQDLELFQRVERASLVVDFAAIDRYEELQDLPPYELFVHATLAKARLHQVGVWMERTPFAELEQKLFAQFEHKNAAGN